MSILNNVGYPNPDRSHFRSMDIWQSASQKNIWTAAGWEGIWMQTATVRNIMPLKLMNPKSGTERRGDQVDGAEGPGTPFQIHAESDV